MESAFDQPSQLAVELDEVREQLRLLSFRLVGFRAHNDQVRARSNPWPGLGLLG